MKSTDQALRVLASLDRTQRRKYLIYFVPQVIISLVEVLGVALIGLTIIVAQNLNQLKSNSVPILNQLFTALNLSDGAILFLLLTSAAICLFLKGVIAPSIQRKILIFLGKISSDKSSDLERRLYALDINFNRRRTSQEIATLFTETSFLVYQGILGSLSLITSELFLIFLLAGLLFSVNTLLTIFIIIYFVVVLYLLNRLSKDSTKKQVGILFESSLAARTNVQESLISYREIYVSQNVENVVNKTAIGLGEIVNARAQLTWIFLFPKYILDVALIFGIILVGGFAYIITDKQNMITLSVLFLVSASRILPSLLRINTGFQGLNNSRDSAERLFAFIEEMELSEKLRIRSASAEPAEALPHYDFEVDALTFKYPDTEKQIISELTFKVPFGDFLAIVGPSGSGKSTLVDLLMGVIDDQSGSIAIGGLSPRQRVQNYPGLIGYVPQKVSLLNRTLKENIAIGVNDHEINEERVRYTLEKVALGDFVFSLKDGIETIVGENGYNFSGGQIQRIGLARALYTNPSILILDEATSALDAQTEHAISESLAALEGEMTLIVVAHRLATVRKANKILYLSAENSFELGTFEELREKVPSFDKQAKLLGL